MSESDDEVFEESSFCRAGPSKNCRLQIGPERSEGLTIGRDVSCQRQSFEGIRVCAVGVLNVL